MIGNKELILDSDMGQIYINRSSKTIPSVILTNGVPYTDLSPIAYASFFNKWIINGSANNIIVDLSKGIYQPVQSRNKLIMNKTNILRFKSFLLFGAIYNTYEKYLKGGADTIVSGTSYNSEISQVRLEKHMVILVLMEHLTLKWKMCPNHPLTISIYTL